MLQTLPVLLVALILAINNRLEEWKTLPVYRQQWHSATITGLTLFLLFALFALAVYAPLNNSKYMKITYKLGSYSYPIYLFHFTPMLTLLSALYAKTHHAVSAILISYATMFLLSVVFAECPNQRFCGPCLLPPWLCPPRLSVWQPPPPGLGKPRIVLPTH